MPEGGLDFDAAIARGAFRFEAAFTVATGETLALVGPSGAGKTTALALVAGLLRPDRGRIACGGETWCDTAGGVHRAPEERHVGLVFQDYALFPHLTVHDNVAYGPRARGRARAEAGASASRWLERLGLGGLEARRVDGLSGGQRQRVALARALASEPRALLLDEPFGALDVATRGSVRSQLRAFLAGCGLPTLLVAHDPVDAFALGDRVAVLEQGGLTQAGTREELLAHPRAAFVAELAGLNLFRAEVARGSRAQAGARRTGRLPRPRRRARRPVVPGVLARPRSRSRRRRAPGRPRTSSPAAWSRCSPCPTACAWSSTWGSRWPRT